MDMPYLLPQDTSVISQVLNDDVGREFLDRLDSVGIHGMAFWFAGFRLMSSNTDINSVDDMKNMKMRIMESNILTSTYKALGAQPIVIAYAETYNALQNGTVAVSYTHLVSSPGGGGQQNRKRQYSFFSFLSF